MLRNRLDSCSAGVIRLGSVQSPALGAGAVFQPAGFHDPEGCVGLRITGVHHEENGPSHRGHCRCCAARQRRNGCIRSARNGQPGCDPVRRTRCGPVASKYPVADGPYSRSPDRIGVQLEALIESGLNRASTRMRCSQSIDQDRPSQKPDGTPLTAGVRLGRS